MAIHRDVEDHGHVALSETRPDRIEVGVGEQASRRVCFAGVDHHGVAAVGERLVEEHAGDLGAE